MLSSLGAVPSEAQLRKIGEMELRLAGISARPENPTPVVPKSVATGIRVVVEAGGQPLSLADTARFLGAGFSLQAELSGPGLSAPLSLPLPDASPEALAADPFLIPVPPLAVSGDYLVSNLRVVSGGRTVLDVVPSSIPLKVIEQILVTSVTTRPLTLDEIKAKGIVLDGDDYLGFEFTMGLKLESNPVEFKFPVVFDRQGVAVPQPLQPPTDVGRTALPPPTILPMLLEAEGPPTATGERERITLATPRGEPIKIPSVLVIPGNIGYLKQFFSAQLYVANGAPVGSGLVLRNVEGSLKLPPGADQELGTADDPLALPELERDGRVIQQPLTMAVRGVGADEAPGTSDDPETLPPAAQGQAEFLIRGEREGFHNVAFDVQATLDGLPIGPVTVKGKAAGGVLVRNPFFNVTFTAPSVVRAGEKFKLYATVTNIGRGIGNDVTLTLDASRMSGLTVVGPGDLHIATLKPGDAQVVAFEFRSQRTGAVVASYLRFDTQTGSTGNISFTVGIGERGVPLSPDTLVLPADMSGLPSSVVDAAMRVLGQAWSIANAPAGTLPPGVTRVSQAQAVKKALALAEAGLRVTLGQDVPSALRDIATDFWLAEPRDVGFDQLLRTTEAGHDLARALAVALGPTIDSGNGILEYEEQTATLLRSSRETLTLAFSGPIAASSVSDSLGRVTQVDAVAVPRSEIPGALWLARPPTNAGASTDGLFLVSSPSSVPYVYEGTVSAAGLVRASVSLPSPSGVALRGEFAQSLNQSARVRITVDPGAPQPLVAEVDAQGDGVFETRQPMGLSGLALSGPELLAASVIGPETIDGANDYGFQLALVFDRPVSDESAADVTHIEIAGNGIQSAKRQLSGRIVFAALKKPEGPYVPVSVSASGYADDFGTTGPSKTISMVSRIEADGVVASGRVLDADGNPVPDAQVVYSVAFPSICVPPIGLSAAPVDANGRYEFHYLRANACGFPSLSVKDPRSGVVRSQTASVLSPGEQIVRDFVYFATGSVTGIVRDLAGNGVFDASVSVVSVTEPQVGASATTDATGRYTVNGITVGPVSVSAGKGVGVGRGSGRIDRPGTAANVDVVLDGGAVTFRGVVRQVDQGVVSVVPNAVVTFSLNQQYLAYRVTDAQGRYEIRDMPPGAYLLFASRDSHNNASVTGVAVAGSTVTQDIAIEIRPAGSVYGTVRGIVRMPDGSPAVGARVRIGGYGALANAQGGYEVRGAPVAPLMSQTVSATSPDGLRVGSNRFVMNAVEVVSGVDITLSGLGSAEFTVLNPTGQPQANQVVRLYRSGDIDPCYGTTVRTDATGRARFEGLPLGFVQVKAIAEFGGAIDAVSASGSIVSDSSTVFGILRFTAGGTVSGIVRNPDGTPSLGADVELRSSIFVNDGVLNCGMNRDVTHRTRTGPDGRFTFTGVHAGDVQVSASQPFFPTRVGASIVLPSGGTSAVELRLVDTISGEISGTVYLPDGVTPAGAGIEVTMNGPLPDVVVTTNAASKFKFAKIFPSGYYTMTARDLTSGLVQQQGVYIPPSTPATHNIRLKGRGTVVVRVVDGLDRPVPNAYVRLTESAFPNQKFEGPIDPSNAGALSFSGVTEGPLAVEVSDPFGRGGRTSATLPQGSPAIEVKVRLASTGTVSGRFTLPSGEPVPNAPIELRSGGRIIGTVASSADPQGLGTYSFEYVPVGSISVTAQDPRSGRVGTASGQIVADGQELVLDIRAQAVGAVEGTVTSNGATAAAQVEVVSGSYRAATSAGTDGRYVVEGVPEGRVFVTASPGSSLLAGSASGNLSGEGSRLTLNVALRPTGTVTGHIVEADGIAPVAFASVQIVIGSATQTTTSDADGAFRFEKIPAGSATILVDPAGSADWGQGGVTVVAAETVDTTVQLVGLGSIRGTALDSAGGPVAGAVTIAGGPSFRRFSHYLALGNDGRFELPNVLAGPFTVQLNYAPPGQTRLYGNASGDVTPGQTTTVTVQLQPSGTVRGRVLRADGVTPSHGATVSLLGPGLNIEVQTEGDGRFVFAGVPVSPSAFTVRVLDPITQGVARSTPQTISSNGQVVELGDFVLDVTAPVLTLQAPLTPVRFNSTSFVIGYSDQGSLVQTSTFSVSTGGQLTFESTGPTTGTATGHTPFLVVGRNTFTVTASDHAGNQGRLTFDIHYTGLTVRGVVRGFNGAPAPGVTVSFGPQKTAITNASGAYEVNGLVPGGYGVSALDPVTQFTVTRSLNLTDGDDSTLDIDFPALGRITGVVRTASAEPAAGVRVTASSRTATTAADGRFDLGYLTLGTYNVVAQDLVTGDTGGASAVLSAPGQVADVSVTLVGLGSVDVTVLGANLAPVPSVSVTLTHSSLAFTRTVTTNALGHAVFSQVVAGNVSLQAVSGARSASTTTPVLPAQTTPVTMTLTSVGDIRGTVLQADGSPAPAVTVTVSGAASRTVTTDATGAFLARDLPLGAYQVEFRRASTGDRAPSASVSLTAEGQVVTVNRTLIGTTPVNVTVRLNGTPTSGVNVFIQSQAGFGDQYSQVTSALGVAAFPNVLVGGVTVQANLSSNGLSGSTTATIVPSVGGAAQEILLDLQSVASLEGTVLSAAGTPVPGATVVFSVRQTTTDASGRYAFSAVALGTGTLDIHKNGKRRAYIPGVTLTTPGETVTQDVTLVAEGRVQGIVRKAGVAQQGAAVTLSQAGLFGATFQATTDASGAYGFDGVAAQSFTISAVKGADRQDATGAVATQGQVVTLDLNLVASAVTLPQYPRDGNGTGYFVDESGPRFNFTSSGSATLGLTIERSGTPHAFASSSSLVTSEDAGRELVLSNADVGGLSVERKVFVPADGYFSRVLERITNPGAAAVTFSAVLQSVVPTFTGGFDIRATSSGDTSFDSQDNWFVFDDDTPVLGWDLNSYSWSIGIAVAGGPSGLTAPRARPTASSFDPVTRVLTVRFDNLVAAPGETIALLHAQAHLADLAGASFGAARLAQAPPELLKGLSASEASEIRNFAIPGDLTSAVPPVLLKSIATVRDQTFDGSPLQARATLKYKSSSPLYPREFQGSQDDEALYGGHPVHIPREPLTLIVSRNFGGLVTTQEYSSTFATTGVRELATVPEAVLSVVGQPTADTSPFVDGHRSGSVSGVFEVSWPQDATLHEVRVLRTALNMPSRVRTTRVQVLNATGTVVFDQTMDHGVALQDATVQLPAVVGRRVRITPVSGSNYGEVEVFGEGSFGPSGKTSVVAKLTSTGAVEGRVTRADGTALGGGSAWIQTTPDTATNVSVAQDGRFSFEAVPAGSYSLYTNHPLDSSTGVVSNRVTVPITVTASTRLTQDLVFPLLGSVTGTLRTGANFPAAGTVTLVSSATGFSRSLSTSAGSPSFGTFTFLDVPAGTYVLTGFDSRNLVPVALSVTVTAGAATSQDVILRKVGSVRLLVTSGGASFAGAWTYWYRDDATPVYVGATGVTGEITIPNVASPFKLYAQHPSKSNLNKVVTGTIAAEGATVNAAIDLTPGTLLGRVLNDDGTEAPGAWIKLATPTGQTIWRTTPFTIVDLPTGVPLEVEAVFPSGFSYGLFGSPVTVAPGGTTVADVKLPNPNLGLDERRIYTFNGIAGRQHELVPDLTPQPHHFSVDVHQPDGSLWQRDHVSVATLPVTGLYTVVVRNTAGTTGRVYLGTRYNSIHNANPGRVEGRITAIAPFIPPVSVRFSKDGSPIETAPLPADERYTLLFRGPGSYTVEALDAGNAVVATRTFEATTGDEVLTNEIRLEPPMFRGRVVAPGNVPVPNAEVTLGATSTTATATGDFEIAIPSGVTTYSAQGAGYSTTGSVTSGGPVTILIPMPVVRVRVQYPDLSPAAGAPVVLCPYFCSASGLTNGSGFFTAIGATLGAFANPAGNAYVVFEDAPGVYFERGFAFDPDAVTAPQDVSITVTPAGTLEITVVDEAGSPLANAVVTLRDSQGNAVREGQTYAQGVVTFGRVGGVTGTVQASRGGVTAQAAVSIPANGTASYTLTLHPPRAQIVLKDEQGSPIANAPVVLRVFGEYDTAWDWSTYSYVFGPRQLTLTTNAEGVATSQAAVGLVQAEYQADGGYYPDARTPSVASGILAEGTSDLVLNLRAGSHEPESVVAADEGRFGVHVPLAFTHTSLPEGAMAKSEYGGVVPGVTLKATDFLADQGAFKRSFVILKNENTTPTDVVLTFRDRGPCCGGGNGFQEQDGYLYNDEGPYYAFVPGAANLTFTRFDEGSVMIRTAVTLPAGSTVGVLFFSTTDNATAAALAAGTVPTAYAGMTDDEKRSIVNFSVPVAVPVTITGTATSHQGDPLPGAQVALNRNGATILTTTANGAGFFSIAGTIFTGAYDLVFVSGTYVGIGSVAFTEGGLIELGPVQAVDPAARGSAQLRLYDDASASSVGVVVTARLPILGALAPIEGATTTAAWDGSGEAALTNLIPGLNRIDTPAGSVFVRVFAGKTTSATLRRGTGPASLRGRVMFDGDPVPGAIVAARQYSSTSNAEVVVAQTTADSFGRYELAGLFDDSTAYLIAWDPDTNRPTTGYHSIPSGAVSADAPLLVLPGNAEVGHVSVRGFLEDTGAPAADVVLQVEIEGMPPFSTTVTLDSNGQGFIPNLPGGTPVLIWYDDAEGLGQERVMSVAPDVTFVDFPISPSRVPLPYTLGGFRDFGNMRVSPADEFCMPFCALQGITVAGGEYTREPYVDVGSARLRVDPDETPREITFSARSVDLSNDHHGRFKVTRRFFLSPDGSFARVVDTLENPSNEDAVTGSYELFNHVEWTSDSWTETLNANSPSASSRALVFSSTAPTDAPHVGLVFGGNGTPNPDEFYFYGNNSWRDAGQKFTNVTLNPGEKRSYMSFIVRDPNLTLAQVETLTQALRDLAVPGMLDGLSAAERALIVNFVLP